MQIYALALVSIAERKVHICDFQCQSHYHDAGDVRTLVFGDWCSVGTISRPDFLETPSLPVLSKLPWVHHILRFCNLISATRNCPPGGLSNPGDHPEALIQSTSSTS